MTINTVEPGPEAEASDGETLTFTLGRIPAGETFGLTIHFQTNPTNIGSHSQSVELYDGGRRVAAVRRSVTVFP